MRISGSGRASAASAKSGRGSVRTAGARFALSEAGDTARAAASAPVSALTAIDAILALQSVEDPLEGKKKALKRGASLLDLLDDIKVELLAGSVSEKRLTQLMAILAQNREKTDPRLDALLDDIELRAEVELAKRGLYRA